MTRPAITIIPPENLERAFEKMGYSGWGLRAQLGEKLNVTPQTIGRWLSPTLDTQPAIDKLIQIAQLANMSLDELILGENYARKEYLSVAVLNMSQAITFVTNGGKFIKSERIPVIGNIRNGFAVRQPDNSMTAISGVSYPKNCLLIFDTNQTPKSEDAVFAIVDNGNQPTGVFRKYSKIGSQEWLIANNQSYPPISANFTVKATLAYAVISEQ